MQKKTLLLVGLLAGMGCVLLGALLKILHWPGADLLLGAGLVASLGGLVLAAVEIVTARGASAGTKVLWLSVLLVGGTLGGLLYVLAGRSAVLDAAAR